ncbi:acyl-activating enzyme 19-like [Plasmopara halstedii]|uniref:Acyl-activating enzyme 19-like n=1 Tax=Plasmopara halstedii TaxID=4781 RepID=A0A0N7L4N4_PLAHL|nr:acyl-activating enzyme 19-like [Plasmopara halstedii]CEG39163.1 acyl-activating enzyme 19-like [Plasmopara halstedii]|eukprot:XP_024575532.1 acyl-activating enzyme 19-like [Plasmopara halstedii]
MALCQCLEKLWRQCRESDEVALVQTADGRVEISYAQIYEWQEKLRSVLGSRDEWLVIGINLTPFSIEESIAMLLIAKELHWIYVPIDIELCISKQRSLLQQAGVQYLVTTAKSLLSESFVSKHIKTKLLTLKASPFNPVKVIQFQQSFDFDEENVDSQWIQSVRATKETIETPLYMLLTSGTTGKPRGVLGTRLGAWRRLQWMWTEYPFATLESSDISTERVLRATKLSFVDSVWEILGAFLKRVPLIHLQSPRSQSHDISMTLIKSVVVDNSTRFLNVVLKENVTRLTAVPSVLELLFLQTTQHDRELAFRKLRYILSSGEPLRLHLLQQFTTQLPNVTILNLYGSTEMSGDVTCMEFKAPFPPDQLERWHHYGIPIAKLDQFGIIGQATSLMLVADNELATTLALDDKTLARSIIWPRKPSTHSSSNTDVSKGVLYVSGPLLSIGYVCEGYNLEGYITLQQKQWFCTGDICCVIQDHLYYCGRQDDAVNIHGHRVYLKAVEYAVAMALRENLNDTRVNGAEEIIALAIATTNSKKHNLLSQQRIVVCIACKSAKSHLIARYSWTKALNIWITAHYGASHAPHDVFLLSPNTIPRLSNGKLDRQALEKILERKTERQVTTVSNVEYKSFIEVRLLQIFENIFDISLSENERIQTFAELGGDSLSSTLLLHELRQAFGAFVLSAQELLNMTIDEILSIVNTSHESSSITDKETNKNSTLYPQDVVKSDLKRQKMKHDVTSEGFSSKECGKISGSRTLSFLARCNQSSQGDNGMYLPTCSLLTTCSASGSSCFELNQAWRVDLSACIDASPLVVQRHDYKHDVNSTWAIIGSHSSEVVCVNVLAGGQEIWRVRLDNRIEASAALSLQHELVYIGTYAGSLYALDLQSGKTQWKFQAQGEIKASSLVIDSHNLVLFGAYDQNFYALDTIVGHLQWVIHLHGNLFSPAYYCEWSNQIFVASTSGNVECLILPSSSVSRNMIQDWNLKLPAPIFAGLNVDRESNILLVGCADGKLYGVNTMSGICVWQVQTEKPIFSSPCVYHSEFVVFGSHDGKLRKVNVRTGAVVWVTNLHGAVFSSPTVLRLIERSFNGLKTRNEERKLICCVTTTTGQLYFCDENNGSIIYQTRQSSGKRCNDLVQDESYEEELGPLFGSPVIVDQYCLIGTRSNYFYAFQMKS